MKIKVSTDRLISAASEAYSQVIIAAEHFNNIENTVKASSYYWEGDGHEAYLNSYLRRIDVIQTSLHRIREHITDLQQIANVYESAENEISGSTESLPVDVIL